MFYCRGENEQLISNRPVNPTATFDTSGNRSNQRPSQGVSQQGTTRGSNQAARPRQAPGNNRNQWTPPSMRKGGGGPDLIAGPRQQETTGLLYFCTIQQSQWTLGWG